MRTGNLALTFLVELACFAGLAYAGAAIGSGGWAVALAVLFPAAAIVVWARWNAPRSAHRLPTRLRVPLELGLYAVTTALLVVAGAADLAAVFAVLVVLNAVLLTAWGQWDS